MAAPHESGMTRVFETADHTGMIADPFGHKWHVSTRKEDVPLKAMQRRWGEMLR